MRTLSGKTLFITGASRGIGRAIALRAARDGANVAIAAKSAVPNPKLPGTIHTRRGRGRGRRRQGAGAASATSARRTRCTPRSRPRSMPSAASTSWSTTPARSGSSGTLDTPMKRFDLMQQVNARGTLPVRAGLPAAPAARRPNPHILSLAPPLNLDPKWWAPHTGYTLAKMGMSFVTLGLAAEFGPQGVAVNALWPRTVIATDAVNMIPGVRLDDVPQAGDRRRCRARGAGAAVGRLLRALPDRRRRAVRGRRHRFRPVRGQSVLRTSDSGPVPHRLAVGEEAAQLVEAPPPAALGGRAELVPFTAVASAQPPQARPQSATMAACPHHPIAPT